MPVIKDRRDLLPETRKKLGLPSLEEEAAALSREEKAQAPEAERFKLKKKQARRSG